MRNKSEKEIEDERAAEVQEEVSVAELQRGYERASKLSKKWKRKLAKSNERAKKNVRKGADESMLTGMLTAWVVTKALEMEKDLTNGEK